MKRLLWISIVLGAVVGAPAAHADDVAKVYASQCASCHGADGRGQTTLGKQVAARDWSDPKVLKPMSDADIETMVRVGKKMMPAYPSLGGPEIKLLVAYVRSFQPK